MPDADMTTIESGDKTTSPAADTSRIGRRIAWSVGCLILGVLISWCLPFIPAELGLWEPSGAAQDWGGLIFMAFNLGSSVISGIVGAIAGAVRPGRQSVVRTLLFSLLTDVFWMGVCLVYIGRWAILYLVSAAMKSVLLLSLRQFGRP